MTRAPRLTLLAEAAVAIVATSGCAAADRFFWASDIPHPDHAPTYVTEVARLARALPEEARAGFLGGNVLSALGIAR